jgi:adenosylhomocysteinase
VDAGLARIEWAARQMPVVRSLRDRLASERPLDGRLVCACLHVTAETAVLAQALGAGGAEVALCAANPFSTQDDVVAALADAGMEVLAARGESAADYASHIAQLAARSPAVALDDGADLIAAVHDNDALLGATEETTTGLVRLRAMAAEGTLRCPVLAVNEALSERTFNDRFGTGQSTLDGILRATNVLLAGRTVVVLGYGATGRGVAQRARGAGASVIVCEVDPMAALEARMEGFDVMPALRAAERGDVFVTVTGVRDALAAEHFERMKDGAILANAGHFDVEISLGDLGPGREVRPLVAEHDVGDRRLYLLAGGRVVNLAAAEGHPAAVMDVSFALHVLAVEELVRAAGSLAPGVHPVPGALDREVAALKLATLDVEIDTLTAEQEAYLRPWEGRGDA